MTEILKGVLMGLVQGITEFLPVSSSGHLVIVSRLLGGKPSGFEEVAFLHLGTLFAIFFYFRKDLWELTVGFFSKSGFARKIVWFLFVASIPAGIVGFGFKDSLEKVFSSTSNAARWLISLSFVFTSVILILSDYIKEKGKKVNDGLF